MSREVFWITGGVAILVSRSSFMDKHFSLVSQKTRDALKAEGRFIMMFPLVYHVDAPSLSTFSTPIYIRRT